MAVPLLDLKAQYQSIKDEVLKVTSEVYDSQLFILGKKVDDFERDFASYCHSKHALGLSSGTDALLIALMVLDIKPGDEVIVPAYSFFATAGVVARLGATPVFVDVEPVGYNIDTRQIEAAVTKKTKAIIPVHLYGQCAEMGEIEKIARKHNLAVVEDAAQAVGADLNGKRAGTFGVIGCFSFFPSKNLGAFGDAGAVTCDDGAMYEKLVDYRVHGMRPKYFHRYVGGNFRIDALQAAILHVKLKHLDDWTEARRKNAKAYGKLFSDKGIAEDRVVLPKELPGRRHIFHQYIIRFTGGKKVREKVMETLKSRNIGHEIYYPLPLSRQECFRGLASAQKPFPVSENAAESTLAIPIYPELTPSQMEEVVDGIRAGLN